MKFSLGSFTGLLLLLLPFLTRAQHAQGRLDHLYRIVEEADSVAIQSQKTFFLEKFLKDDYNYRETWRYAINRGKIVYFQVDYLLDSTEYTEVYYLDRGRLICSEEYEKIDYDFMEDKLKFGSILFFESTTPRHVVTLGRRSYNWRMTEPGDLALTRFQKRYSELKRHLPMLP